MPPKRANSASTVAAPARKRSRRVKSSQSPAGVIQQTQRGLGRGLTSGSSGADGL